MSTKWLASLRQRNPSVEPFDLLDPEALIAATAAGCHAALKVEQTIAMHTIPAIYDQGVFRPVTPVDLPDRTQVEVLMPVASGSPQSEVEPASPSDGTYLEPFDQWLAHFESWMSRQPVRNPRVDDSRDSAYPDRS